MVGTPAPVSGRRILFGPAVALSGVVVVTGLPVAGPCARCDAVGPLDPIDNMCLDGCGYTSLPGGGVSAPNIAPSPPAAGVPLPSRAHSGGARPAPRLRFRTAVDLIDAAPPVVPWVLDGYIASGAITLLAGKPKVGKSTLICALIEALVTGARSFPGRAVTGGPVVLVSEESSGTLAGKLPYHPALQVLSRDDAFAKPDWADLIAGAVRHARREKAVLLVIDTLAYWSALGADREKDAGSVQAP